jgi:hypothetical protein
MVCLQPLPHDLAGQLFKRFCVVKDELDDSGNIVPLDHRPVLLDFEATNSAMPAVTVSSGWDYVGRARLGTDSDVRNVNGDAELLQRMAAVHTKSSKHNVSVSKGGVNVLSDMAGRKKREKKHKMKGEKDGIKGQGQKASKALLQQLDVAVDETVASVTHSQIEIQTPSESTQEKIVREAGASVQVVPEENIRVSRMGTQTVRTWR